MDRLRRAAMLFLLRVRKLAAALTNPIYRRAIRFGVAPSIEHIPPLRRFSFDHIVDIGANRGQFATFCKATFRGCRIISFEPLPGPASRFEKIFEGDPGVRLVRAAEGTTRGALKMRVAE